MMQMIETVNAEEAIRRLSRAAGEKVIICMVDFDNNKEAKKAGTKDEGYTLIRNAKTILCDNDDIVQHLALFSVLQEDIEHILPKGIVHDIIFCMEDVRTKIDSAYPKEEIDKNINKL